MPTKSAAGIVPTATVEKILSDYEGRVENAFATSNRMMEQAAAFTRANVEAAFASTRIAVSGMDTLAKQAGIDPVGEWKEMSAAWTKFPSVKNPAELISIQSDQASALMQQALARAAKLGDAMLKLGFDIADPIAGRCSAAIEELPAWTEK